MGYSSQRRKKGIAVIFSTKGTIKEESLIRFIPIRWKKEKQVKDEEDSRVRIFRRGRDQEASIKEESIKGKRDQFTGDRLTSC